MVYLHLTFTDDILASLLQSVSCFCTPQACFASVFFKSFS